jgi:hypothetical protein
VKIDPLFSPGQSKAEDFYPAQEEFSRKPATEPSKFDRFLQAHLDEHCRRSKAFYAWLRQRPWR